MTEEQHGLSRGLTNYGDADFSLYLRRSFAKSMGYSAEMLSRPVVGIAQSASGFNNCHRHFPELVEAVKRGVLAMGGLPLDFPTISLGEIFLSPTSMMFRNLMAMDVEEMIRAQPMDAVVLIGACDKTVPALLMGAASADVPAIQLVGGPMLPMGYRGERLGACTDCRRFWAKYRANEISLQDIEDIESNLATTTGSCAVMGTASTMAAIAEALGMSLPGTAAIPAVHADRLRAAEASGRRAVAMIKPPLRPSRIMAYIGGYGILLVIPGVLLLLHVPGFAPQVPPTLSHSAGDYLSFYSRFSHPILGRSNNIAALLAFFPVLLIYWGQSRRVPIATLAGVVTAIAVFLSLSRGPLLSFLVGDVMYDALPQATAGAAA